MADEFEKEETEKVEGTEEAEGQVFARSGDKAPDEEAGRASSRTTMSDSDEDVEGQSYLRTRTT